MSDGSPEIMKDAVSFIRKAISALTTAHYKCFCKSGDYDEPYHIRDHIAALRIIEMSLKPHALSFEEDMK